MLAKKSVVSIQSSSKREDKLLKRILQHLTAGQLDLDLVVIMIIW